MTHILIIRITQKLQFFVGRYLDLGGGGRRNIHPPPPFLPPPPPPPSYGIFLNKALVWLLISPSCVFAGNPNPVTTAPQEESLPDLSHSDVTHLLPPSVAVASGMGRPTSSSSSSSSSYSLMPGTGAGRGYSDDERDSVEDTLKNLEEKTQKMHGMLNCFC